MFVLTVLFVTTFAIEAGAQNLSQAVDIDGGVTTVEQFNCLKKDGVDLVFLNYKADADNSQDRLDNLSASAANALQAGLGVEIVFTPIPSYEESFASKQAVAVVHAMNFKGIKLNAVWIKASKDIGKEWHSYKYYNSQFIRTVISTFLRFKVGSGIYTSVNDWYEITDGIELGKNVKLWYTNGREFGASPPNFDDFLPFGSWKYATAKQYHIDEKTACGVVVGRDVYEPPLSWTTKKKRSSNNVIGTLFY